jgi:diguanylate cyclase (GGDEF)-like protein/PAS domain S-box-containing protein
MLQNNHDYCKVYCNKFYKFIKDKPAMRHVLYIEDDFMTALLVQEWLSHDNYRVDWAHSATEGKQFLQHSEYDIVLVDYFLPETTGLEFIQDLGGANFHLPVIMLTGVGDEKIAVEAMKSGVTDYISKAQLVKNPQLLLIAIANALEQHKNLQAQQQADIALRQSEELYHQLFECSKAVNLLIDPQDGKIVDVNTAAQNYYGYSKLRLRNMFIWEINMLSQDEVQAEMQLAQEEKRSYFRFRHRLATGEVRHVEVHSGPFTASHRVLLYSIVHDVTDRIKAEQALIESEKRFRLMADSAPVFIWMSDTDGGCIYLNKGRLEFTGKTLAEEYGDGWTKNLHPDDCLQVVNIYRQAFKKHESFRMEYRLLRHADQRYRWMLDIGVPRFNEIAEFAGYIGTCVDITERKQIENQLQQLLEQQQVILNNIPMGIAFVDADRRFIRINQKMEEVFGYSEQELLDESTTKIYADLKTWDFIGEIAYPILGQGKTYHTEQLMRRKDGSSFWCRLLGRAVNPKNPYQGTLWNIEDTTAKRQTDEKLRLASAVFETSSEAIFVTNAQQDNVIIMINPAFTEITGYQAQDILGQHPNVLTVIPYHDDQTHEMQLSLHKKGKWQGELMNRRKDGIPYPAWVSISAIKNNEEEVTQYVSIFSDITERKKAEAALQHSVHHDELTGLPNRTFFLKRLEEYIQLSQKHKTKLALFFVDLDRFKWVNDNFGHDIGNLLLIAVAQRLKQCTRNSDMVSRLSGDEFTLILPNLLQTSIVKVIAARVVNSLAAPFHLSGHVLSISGSVGIAIYPQDGDDIQTLLKHADIAMYNAKGAGRNNYQFYVDHDTCQHKITR